MSNYCIDYNAVRGFCTFDCFGKLFSLFRCCFYYTTSTRFVNTFPGFSAGRTAASGSIATVAVSGLIAVILAQFQELPSPLVQFPDALLIG